jgi:hypothetical protein
MAGCLTGDSNDGPPGDTPNNELDPGGTGTPAPADLQDSTATSKIDEFTIENAELARGGVEATIVNTGDADADLVDYHLTVAFTGSRGEELPSATFDGIGSPSKVGAGESLTVYVPSPAAQGETGRFELVLACGSPGLRKEMPYCGN